MSKPEMQKQRKGMMGGGPMRMTTEKPKNFKKSIGKLLRYLKPHKFAMIVTIITALIAVGFSIISPRVLGGMTNQIVDDFIAVRTYDAVTERLPDGVELPSGTTVNDLMSQMGDHMPAEMSSMMDNIPEAQRELIENLDISTRPQFHYEVLAQTGLLLVAIYLVSLLANYICGWVSAGVVQRIVKKMRTEISVKINRLPISYFDKHQFGDTLSRVTNDVDTISQSLNQALTQALTAIFMLIGILGMMFSISWLMALLAIIILPLSFVVIGFIIKHSQKHFKNQQDRLADLNGHIEEAYAGQVIVKTFNAEKKTANVFSKINQKLYISTWRSQFLSGLMMPIMNVISNLGYVAAAVLGGWLAINGRLSIGDIQAFIQYMGQINQPITQSAQIANLLQSTAAAAERVFEFLEESEEINEDDKIIEIKHVKGEVNFDNVNFGYLPGKKIIKNFSVRIKPGQKVAIVGPTGAGKTTIINLLMRFYNVDSGSISIDGISTNDMKRSEVRQLFGMVLQDTWLMNGTIRENLKYGKLDATDEQIKKAASAAHVEHFVRSLPEGYNTKIDEDSETISSGERQLLTIARVMVADAPMLILDEATSNVDTRTEILIQEAMERLMNGRTTFVIAHRLSTIVNSDLILVMKDGNIIEQGTHRKLLADEGFYADLYNSQFVK